MTTEAARDNAGHWIPLGIVLGAAFGEILKDIAFGMSLGLMAGATVSMVLDYKGGTRSVIWPIVGGFAFMWLVALFFIERA